MKYLCPRDLRRGEMEENMIMLSDITEREKIWIRLSQAMLMYGHRHLSYVMMRQREASTNLVLQVRSCMEARRQRQSKPEAGMQRM